MTIEALRDLIVKLTNSAGAVAAIGVALDARTSDRPIEPRLRPHIDDLLRALGADQMLEGVTAAELHPVLSEIRVSTAHNAKLLSAATRGMGWTHLELELLQAAGDVSAAFPHALKRGIVPNLEGLAARLDGPNAMFLDVGVGVASLSIQMARVWPALKIVGVDVWRPSLELARENVKKAGLESRIELREQSAADLPDSGVFDLAWIPTLFIPEAALPSVVERVFRTLKPGGWLLFPTMKAAPDPMATALARLRIAQFGGPVVGTEELEAMLNRFGYAEVRSLPTPPTSPVAMVVGRRLA